MNYASLSFHTLRRLYDIHMRLAVECPEAVTECDHAERHELAAELDRRFENGDTK